MRLKVSDKFNVLFNNAEKIALVFGLVFGILSAVLVPQMSVNDEGAHFLKSYSLSTGKLAGKECAFPLEIIDKSKTISTSSVAGNLFNGSDNSPLKNTTCGSAGNYSPIMHLPQAIGIGIGRTLQTSPDMLVLLGRITNALFYAIALFFIVKYAKIGKWVFVVIGLFPFMIHTAGSLSGDVMNSVIVMASLMFIFNLFVQSSPISRKQIVLLLGISVLLAITKSTNVILLLTLVALPARLFEPDARYKLSSTARKWIVLVACALTALAFVLLAQKLLGSALFIRDAVENPLKTDPLRFFYILYNTYINPVLGYGDLLLRGVVGEFSSFRYHLPTGLVFIELVLLGFVLLYQDKTKRFKQREVKSLAIASVLSLILLVLAVTLALYSAWAIQSDRLGPNAIYADGVQGRYFTAALVALIPVGAFLQKYIWLSTKPTWAIAPVVFFTSLFVLCFYLAETILVYT